jgi:hypothetical protein
VGPWESCQGNGVGGWGQHVPWCTQLESVDREEIPLENNPRQEKEVPCSKSRTDAPGSSVGLTQSQDS